MFLSNNKDNFNGIQTSYRLRYDAIMHARARALENPEEGVLEYLDNEFIFNNI